MTEGFETVEDLATTPVEDLAEIEGFDETIGAELQRRAQISLDRRAEEQERRRVDLGVSDELTAIEPLTPAMLIALGEAGVKTLDDLADLAGDELIEIVGSDALDKEVANAIIMDARAHWFREEHKSD